MPAASLPETVIMGALPPFLYFGLDIKTTRFSETSTYKRTTIEYHQERTKIMSPKKRNESLKICNAQFILAL
jgi:hypothetical protein